MLDPALRLVRVSYPVGTLNVSCNNPPTCSELLVQGEAAGYGQGLGNVTVSQHHLITFPNGATYSLDNRGTELDGSFVAGTENHPINFRKSYSVAGR